ncbi:MAG TPA: segregation/condensation protein A [Flexilinea sp.]|jgi:segregation and condensation protein A|nr:segregation/condensation protein A [Flexilinea sp.]OQA26500.1 MAG: Segregation and condensation protein A [Chloroflexi bacterium ADurb.Bin344]HOG22890.1 segregation/condensation protein A [Flexilinea sp.]HOP02004.1 segregation/condensation protein A [Flexilinea sp.]HOR56987.1 segregation/condensation protein A [Flexilinea sp.]
MAISFNSFRSGQYQIETDLYQGPLDLLLDLIEKAELDITVLSLAQVTDQFLEYIKNMEGDNPAEVSAFVVIAARLIQIKSSALLPHSETDIRELDEDSGEALAQQLILYRRFKQLAGWLAQREDLNYHSYERMGTPDIGIEAPLDLSNLTVIHLAAIAGRLFAKKPEQPELATMISQPRITIGQRIQLLIGKVREKRKISFRKLLSSGSKVEAVVTFLAMLELIKRNVISVNQDDLFADIEIRASDESDQEQSLVSEFGE